MRLAVVMVALLGVAACGGESAGEVAEGDATGEVLPGSASDAMIPLDQLRSEAPADPQGTSVPTEEGTEDGEAGDAAEPDGGAPATETPRPGGTATSPSPAPAPARPSAPAKAASSDAMPRSSTSRGSNRTSKSPVSQSGSPDGLSITIS